jgi:hypothetical protein
MDGFIGNRIISSGKNKCIGDIREGKKSRIPVSLKMQSSPPQISESGIMGFGPI